jgi:4-amino-4-deoxy-L-arabinose transferase-like glycosyltransferase
MPIRSLRTFRSAAIALVLLTIVTRLPALLHPWPLNDEAAYSVVANEIVDGGRPYIDAVDRKPPLLFWTYAAVFKVAGKYNWAALHAVAVAWILCTMAGLFVIGKRMFDRDTGLIAALLYGIFQPWGTPKNLAFNGEVLMNLPIVCAWAIALRRSPSILRLDLLLAGALLCAAFLLKQPAAIAAVPLGLYLLLRRDDANRRSPTAAIIDAAMLTAGFFGALGLVAIVLWKQDILRDAFFWTIANHSAPHVFWTKGLLQTLGFAGACLPLVAAAALTFRDKTGVWANKGSERTALFGLVIASALGVAAGGRFYPHYFIQLIPPLALLAAPTLARVWSPNIQARHWLLRPALVSVWLVILIVGFSMGHWLHLIPERAPSETGKYLSEHSASTDRIFVWGHEPKIYLEAQRRPACRYILTFPLTGYVFGGPLPGVDTRKWIIPGAWETLEQDFRQHPPVFIVDLCFDQKNAPYPISSFPILETILTENYQPVAQTAEGIIYRRR